MEEVKRQLTRGNGEMGSFSGLTHPFLVQYRFVSLELVVGIRMAPRDIASQPCVGHT